MTDVQSVVILVDEPEDGCVESSAWVQKNDLTPTHDAALKALESEYPIEDLPEDACYQVAGVEWLRPVEDAETDEYMPWRNCGEEDPQGFEFWTVKVVCSA